MFKLQRVRAQGPPKRVKIKPKKREQPSIPNKEQNKKSTGKNRDSYPLKT